MRLFARKISDRIVFLLSAVLASFAPLVACGGQEAYDTVIERYFDGTGPGAAVAVCREGKIAYARGIGLADLKKASPITRDSLFDLASLSKQITGLAILSLVSDGRLDLGSPVSDVLADYAVPVKGRAVTIADLLHHISGLADYTGSEWDGSDEEFAQLTLASHLAWLNTTKPRRPPGIRYEYNNSNYVLLAAVVERVSEKTFAQFVEERIFLPSGMKETFIYDGQRRLPASVVKGYVKTEKGTWKRSLLLVPVTGDGNVYSSVNDLARLDRAIRSHTLLDAGLQARAWTNAVLDTGEPLRADGGGGYGLGWSLEPERGIVSHSGSWMGTAAYYLFDRKRGISVIVLSNDEEADVQTLCEALWRVAKRK